MQPISSTSLPTFPTVSTTMPVPQERSAPESLRDQVRPVAEEWVGQTFFGTLLKQARANPLGDKEGPFSGGRGGAAFSGLFDQQMAEQASRGLGGKLVDVLVDRIAGKASIQQLGIDITG